MTWVIGYLLAGLVMFCIAWVGGMHEKWGHVSTSRKIKYVVIALLLWWVVLAMMVKERW